VFPYVTRVVWKWSGNDEHTSGITKILSHKLNSAQRNYTTGEKKLLSVVETLREYRTMLFGCRELHVYTDHKNLTFTNLQTQRVLRWRLFIEEFSPIFHYIQGAQNTFADALSRLPFSERQNTPESQLEKPSDIALQQDAKLTQSPEDNVDTSFFSMAIDDDDLLDCFVHLPDDQGIPFRMMDYETIAEAQVQDAALLQGAHPSGATTPCRTERASLLLRATTWRSLENIHSNGLASRHRSMVSLGAQTRWHFAIGRHALDALPSSQARSI
jgi:RNase H-like domain found in reverse transcriptase